MQTISLVAELTDPRLFVYYVGVTIQLAAAAWLFYLAPGDPRHRSFAVLVTCNAVWDLLEGLYHAAAPPRDAYYLRVYAYLFVWTVASVVWFLSVYPRPHAFARWTTWGALAFAASTTLWLALDRSALQNPLLELVWLGWTPLFAFGAFVILREVQRREDPRTWSMLLVAMSFLVYPISTAVELVRPNYWRLLVQDLRFDSLEGAVIALVEAALFLARLAAVVLVAWTLRLTRRQPEHASRKLTFLALLLGLIVGTRFLEPAGLVLPGQNALVFGILVSYALARGHLFDIDLKIKLTITRGTIVGAFGGVFFIVSQMAELYFEQGGNYVLGGIACGLLLLAYGPLHRWADRIAAKTLPADVTDTPEYARLRKRHIYLAALVSVMEDHRVTVKERAMLGVLAERLALTPADLRQLQQEAERMVPPAPQAAATG